MKIAIAGTRGVPNRYGGFEQFAEFLSEGLVKKNVEVFVYCPHNHSFKGQIWNNVKRILKYCPRYPGGAVSQFIYDLLCILDSRKRKFDIILHLGYTSSSLWFGLHPGNAGIITNMDGLEWKREKYNLLSRAFLKYAEKKAVNRSDIIIADSRVIKDYLDRKYRIEARHIAYPATIPSIVQLNETELGNLKSGQYYLVICRLQKDNNIETILEAYMLSQVSDPLIIIGDTKHKYGRYLKKKYESRNVIFHGSLYDKKQLDALRFHCRLYFHGHSAGGTNPSLLEAMAAGALICAHDNPFNREVLEDNALFFNDKHDIVRYLKEVSLNKNEYSKIIESNLQIIRSCFAPDLILDNYYELFEKTKDV